MSPRAVTRRVDIDLDPTSLAGHDDAVVWHHRALTLAGRGVAAEITADPTGIAAVGTLTDIATEREPRSGGDRPGTGAVALGALQFASPDPAARALAGTLVVPEVLYGKDRDGNRWVTWVGEGPTPELHELVARLSEPAPQRANPDRYTIASSRPAQDWCESVLAARDALRAGPARKVVLARDLVIDCDTTIDRGRVLARLAQRFPTCFVFAMPTLTGASPELLVTRNGDVVRAQPMAGTISRNPDPGIDARMAAALLSSAKDRTEHQITIDMVHDTLLGWCSHLDAQTEPEVVSIANLHHLATMVEGRLSIPAPSVLELVAALHPTPAVGGDPHDAARALIAEHEQLDRGSYAAPVGWMDSRGNGEFAVGVRSAEIRGNQARLFAGVGVVADSDPFAELEETRVKLEAMLGAVVRP